MDKTMRRSDRKLTDEETLQLFRDAACQQREKRLLTIIESNLNN